LTRLDLLGQAMTKVVNEIRSTLQWTCFGKVESSQ
jgi:hypothetical protein